MSQVIRYITAPHPQNPQVIFLPVVNFSNPTQLEPIPISKFNSFNIFNKHHSENQRPSSQYKTIPENSPSRKYKSVSFTPQQPQFHHQPNRRFDYNFGNNPDRSSFDHRDGWSYGVKGGKQSPAISALALLGFLFFLNLIQNSLLNNRFLLTSSAYNGTVIGGSNIVYGRNGRVRRKRGLIWNEYISTPESIITHPNRQLPFVKNPKLFQSGKMRKLNHGSRDRTRQRPQPMLFNDTRTIVRSLIRQQVQQTALGCLQLMACNMGRTIFKDTGPGGRMLMRFLGQRLFPGSTKRSWTGRMVRAMTYGWGKVYRCDRLFKRCVIPNLFGLIRT